jgi:hypothetical protein
VIIAVTNPADDRAVARMAHELKALDLTVSQQRVPETTAQAQRVKTLVAALQSQFRVEVHIFRSPSDAVVGIHRGVAGQAPGPTGSPLSVLRSRRMGSIVYLTSFNPGTIGVDAAFQRVIAVAQHP